jgi:hypothetical protein
VRNFRYREKGDFNKNSKLLNVRQRKNLRLVYSANHFRSGIENLRSLQRAKTFVRCSEQQSSFVAARPSAVTFPIELVESCSSCWVRVGYLGGGHARACTYPPTHFTRAHARTRTHTLARRSGVVASVYGRTFERLLAIHAAYARVSPVLSTVDRLCGWVAAGIDGGASAHSLLVSS